MVTRACSGDRPGFRWTRGRRSVKFSVPVILVAEIGQSYFMQSVGSKSY